MPKPDLVHVARAICEVEGARLLKREGAGTFKETFSVEGSDGSRYALKVFFPGTSNPERTEREVKAMSRCNHPNVAKLFSLSSISYNGQDHLFITEEYLEGGTLKKRLTRGALTPFEAMTMGRQLIEAIDHIASLDLVHRDLKPDNIMFRADGVTPVVVDFGVVRDLSASSLTQTYLLSGPGTPLYMAPEQLNNEKELIDWRTDQFALGLVISFAVFGYHPFAAPTDQAPTHALERVANRERLSEMFVSQTVTAGLPVLMKMLEGWPVDRFRTPAALARAWETQEEG